jgi:hypothetical protein
MDAFGMARDRIGTNTGDDIPKMDMVHQFESADCGKMLVEQFVYDIPGAGMDHPGVRRTAGSETDHSARFQKRDAPPT